MGSAHSSNLVQELETSLQEHEDDASLNFALGMVYKRGGYLDRAEQHYNQALELGAPAARIQNNLGVIAFMRGHYDEALALLDESIRSEPERAASHFNLSQTFAKKLFFEKADQELSRANELAFNQIRDALRYTEGDARKTMIDEPLPELALWKAAWNGERFMPGLPEWIAFSFAGNLWIFSPIAILVFVFAYILGRRLYQNLPTTGCTNCGRPVCRRCVRRVRREMYCGHCGDVLLRIQSSSYSKLVLDSQIRRNRRFSTIVGRISTVLLPGLHAARTGRSSLAAVLALGAMIGVLALVSRSLPVDRMAWIPDAPAGPWWPEIPIAFLVIVFAISTTTVIKLKKSKLAKRASRIDEADFDEAGPEEAADAA